MFPNNRCWVYCITSGFLLRHRIMWKSILIFTAVLFNKSESFQGPMNMAAIVGSDVTMSCASNDSVTWTFFGLDSRMSKLIYANFTLESQHERFTVKGNTVDGRSHLTINGVVPEDAGTYWCFTVRQQDKAQLIVIASDPICNIDGGIVSTNNSIHVNENDFVKALCTIRTWGNWLPKMDWSVLGGPVLEVGVNETTKGHSVLTINASTVSTEATQLACEIYFTAENNPDKTEVWNNIPSYVYSWRSPVIFIKRSRTNEGQTTQPVEWNPTANSILDENEPSLFSHTHDSHRTVSVEPSARVISDNNPNTVLLIIISVLSTLLVVVIIGTSIFCCCYNQRKKLGNSREGNAKDGSGPVPSSTESRSMDYYNSGKQFKSSRPLSAYFNPYSMIDENEMTSSLERRTQNSYASMTRNYAEILASSKETLNSDYDDVSPSTNGPPGNKYNNKEAMTNKYYTPLGGLVRHKRALADYTKFNENISTLNEGKSNYCLENRTTVTDEMLVGSGLGGTQETDKEITTNKYTPLGEFILADSEQAICSKLGNPESLPSTGPGLSSSIENLLSILETKDGVPSKQVKAKDEVPSKQKVSTDGAPTKLKESTDGVPLKQKDSTDGAQSNQKKSTAGAPLKQKDSTDV